VCLPLAPEASESAEDDPLLGAADRPLRILIVEDNRVAAKTLRMYLAERGHVLEVAHGGPEGLDAAERFHPEVVLCDIGLPGIDGYRVARALRERRATAGALLIAISGYGQEADRTKARQAGFDHHLTKPVDLQALSERLSRG
jgi:two-component system CheB/CheR fusion protein